MQSVWFKIEKNLVKINIFAKPNAKKTAFLGIGEQGLLIAIHAKPHQGAANQELISYLAKHFHVPKTKVTLLKGETSRHKQVEIPLTDEVHQIILRMQS